MNISNIGSDTQLPKVTVKRNEPIEKALRRFKKQCKKESLITEIKKRRCYIKPSERRRMRLNKAKKNR